MSRRCWSGWIPGKAPAAVRWQSWLHTAPSHLRPTNKHLQHPPTMVSINSRVSCYTVLYSRVYVSGPNPTYNCGIGNFTRLLSFNNWSSSACHTNNIHFSWQFGTFSGNAVTTLHQMDSTWMELAHGLLSDEEIWRPSSSCFIHTHTITTCRSPPSVKPHRWPVKVCLMSSGFNSGQISSTHLNSVYTKAWTR